MKLALALLLLALAALALPASPAYAQIELTEADPADGARLDAPPEVVHLCFSQPVNIEDTTSFDFGYLLPDGRSLGLRIAFQLDGKCVDVFPGLPDDYPAGEYTFDWRVTAAEGDEVGSGTLRFQITEAGAPSAPQTPRPGETAGPATPTPEGGTPAPSPAGGAGAAEEGGGNGPDVLFLSLITIASVGGAAVLFTLGYILRRRIGYEPHRPPEDGGEGEGH